MCQLSILHLHTISNFLFLYFFNFVIVAKGACVFLGGYGVSFC